MTLDYIRNTCLSFDDVTEDIKWGHDICFSIGGKMFLVTSADANPIGASFKAGDEDFIGKVTAFLRHASETPSC